ncbi:nuclear transport factor 2 family protein [Streptomyces sp. WAC06614]|uniref:nuclear transport factor 2 family protein n=1 Tax=Streptomyces sp. WAC06614 TaxID=2487416 RepID=UPI000F77C52A|nr:nuclear transport factor 2 family protein [Streptomyces sp. WAC06614]RSS82168.1 nuclear transport factor 2 family protein [Streptomyces sp. WAC06614]
MSKTPSAPQNPDAVRAAAQQAFRNHLAYLSAGRITEWVDLFTEDGVLEFPYAPKGFPARTEGKEGLFAYMRNFPEHFRVEFVDLHFHETVDPSLVIAEFKSKGVALSTGRPYDQTYISVVETEEGRISRYVDFWNPLVGMEALGGDSTDMVSAFGTD